MTNFFNDVFYSREKNNHMDTWVLYTKPGSEDGPGVPIIQTCLKESPSSACFLDPPRWHPGRSTERKCQIWPRMRSSVSWNLTTALQPLAPGPWPGAAPSPRAQPEPWREPRQTGWAPGTWRVQAQSQRPPGPWPPTLLPPQWCQEAPASCPCSAPGRASFSDFPWGLESSAPDPPSGELAFLTVDDQRVRSQQLLHYSPGRHRPRFARLLFHHLGVAAVASPAWAGPQRALHVLGTVSRQPLSILMFLVRIILNFLALVCWNMWFNFSFIINWRPSIRTLVNCVRWAKDVHVIVYVSQHLSDNKSEVYYLFPFLYFAFFSSEMRKVWLSVHSRTR